MKGITFGNIHSYRDMNLVLSAVNIPPAAVKTNFVDIPGGDGSIDMTEAHGKVCYKDRTCTFTFSVLPEDDFEVKKKEVSNLLNGLRCKIFIDKDPGYYWIGRLSINDYQASKKLRKITVGAVVAPYKYKINETSVFVPFCGKNLLDPNYLEDTSNFIQNDLAYISVPILLKPNTTYTISYSSIAQPTSQIVLNIGYAPWESTSQQNILAKVFNIVNEKTVPASKMFKTTGATMYYLQYYMNGYNLTNWTVDEWFTRMCSNLQLEISSYATAYEPYEAITTKDITLTNARKDVCPVITCSSDTTLTVNGNEFDLSKGTHKILDIQLHEGETPVTVSGTGAVAFVYQEGDL